MERVYHPLPNSCAHVCKLRAGEQIKNLPAILPEYLRASAAEAWAWCEKRWEDEGRVHCDGSPQAHPRTNLVMVS